MKHLILLLFMIIPKASFALTVFTHLGDPDILYNGSVEELLTMHQKIATGMEIALQDETESAELFPALCDLDCQVLTAAGLYENAREVGLLSVQTYEVLLATPEGKENPDLLLDYAAALCNLAEVCGRLFVNKDEVLVYHSKAAEAIKQRMMIQAEKGMEKVEPKTAMRVYYSNISLSQILCSLSLIGRDYVGCIQRVEKEITEITDLYEALNADPHETNEYIMALQTYATIYNRVEDYEQALRYWTESLAIIEKMYGKQSRLYAYTLKEIGWIYYALNDLEIACDYFNKSFEVYQAGGFIQSAEVGDLMNLGGMAFLNSGQFEAAADAFKQGGTIFEATCGKKSFPTNLNKAFSVYPLWYTKQNKKAEKLLSEVLNDSTFAYNLDGDHFFNAAVFGLEMDRTDKNYKEVYRSEEKMNQLVTQYGNVSKSSLKQYYITLGRTYQSDNKMIEACPYFSQALSLLRDITRQNFAFLSEAQRSNFWLVDQTRFASILRQNQSKQEENNAIGALLYDAALLQKSMLLEASVNLARVVEEKGTPELKQKMRHLQMMMQSDLTDEQKRECQALETEVQNEARKYGDFMTHTNVVWTDVQKALDDHSVAVEFICSNTEDGKTHYSAEVLRKGMDKPFHLNLFTVEKDELTHGAGKGQFNDFALKNIWPERMLKLFQPGDNVYFAPSGALHMLPIEYMPMENGQRMDEIYRMHRLSSTREVVRNVNANSNVNLNTNSSKGQKSIALFGGFNFNASDDDMELAMVNSSANAGETRGKSKASGTAYWNNLPGTLNEVKNIAPIMEKARYKVALHIQDGGTESLFKAVSGLHTDIIHVATHGYYIDGKGTNLNQSGLIFSGGNNHWASHKESQKEIQADDGILTAEEIAHINLIGTNLTVLSACQTGLGEVTGEGVFGLQRSFKKAGVQSLLMSLWEVDDEATQLLMTAFYTHYAQGKTKQEALQAAQQEVRHHQFVRDGKERSGEDPYFWAGFILVDG